MRRVLVLCAACGLAQAQDVAVYGALATDYLFRGVSSSDGHGAVQLGIDVSGESGLFGGIWASTTDITTGNRNRTREVDYYLGYVHYFANDWSASLSINHYSYPGAEGNVDYNYTEWASVVSIDDRLWFEVNYTNSIFGHRDAALNLEALVSWPLPGSLSLSIGIGYFDVSDFAGNAYTYWQLGVSRPFAWTTLDLRFHDSNNVPARISPADLADSRIVLTISAAF